MRVDSHRFTLRKTVRVGSHRHSVTKTPCEHPRTVFLLREPRSSVVMRGLRNGKTVRVSSHSFALTKICVRGQGQGSSSYIGPSAVPGILLEYTVNQHRGIIIEEFPPASCLLLADSHNPK